MENKSGAMSFFVACQNGDVKTAKQLLKLADPPSLLSTWEGRTCFHVAVIAEDSDLLRELAAKLPVPDLIQTITMKDNIGDTGLHVAVRKNRADLAKQLVEMEANLCDCANKEGETPLTMAVSLGFEEAVEFLITHTQNGLHYVVKLNQVRVVQFLRERDVELSKLISQPYQPSDGGDEGLTKASRDGGDIFSQSAGWNKSMADEKGITESTKGTNTQNDQPIVLPGDTALHIAARNKFEHMVNLLLKVPGVDKLALNSENKTPFDVAREVTEYHEYFGIIRKLGDSRRPKRFMYCAPQVSHKKLMEARRVVRKSYEDRRNADQIVAVLLATMTFTAAFTVPGGFQTDTKQKDELGSPVLLSFTSFKIFLIFDCVAFFLALFICILRQMIPEHATGDTGVHDHDQHTVLLQRELHGFWVYGCSLHHTGT